MSTSLVIVESPAKVKSISKFLGSEYIVKSSVGHVRDLAKSGSSNEPKEKKKKAKGEKKNEHPFQRYIDKMGINPEKGWEAQYEILPGKEKVLKALKASAQKADTIYLATDLDREGEAIAWHLKEAIGGDPARYKRVTFTEITKNAVRKAFETPSQINTDRVNAQQARRFLDRVVGYMLSPLLWEKVARGLSAGRVQSVAVRLITEREREIHAFKTEEYWEIDSSFKTHPEFSAKVVKKGSQNFRPTNEASVKEDVKALAANPYIVNEIEKKPSQNRPSAPFITSTMQQSASVRLGFGVKKTMTLAQKLYEAGYITYMRTDSTNLSKEAVEQVREFIKKEYGSSYLPEQPNVYSSKKTAQEAHEAIRPTSVLTRSEDLAKLKFDTDEVRLYDMIRRQFIACQMAAAEFFVTNLTITCGEYTLKAKGRILKFDGFLKIQPQLGKKKEDSVVFPDLKEKDKLELKEISPSQHFTKPPPRYTEASLVRELEKRGIGRPSTYAAIISTIQERGYVRVGQKRFYCLKMGEIVTDRLLENFDDLMNYGFTANLEEELDKIAAGDLEWLRVLDTFYDTFLQKLIAAKSNMKGNEPTLTELPCPECSRPMNIRTARTGVFLSCSGYSLDSKERCKGTLNLQSADDFEAYSSVSSDEDEEGDVSEIRARKRCLLCDTAMDSYIIDAERKLYVCGNNPGCSGNFLEKGMFRVKGYEGPTIQCDKCGQDMQLKSGRFGKYFGCTGAPECKNTRKLLRSGEAAPPKAEPIHMPELPCEKSSGYFVLRDGASGLFLASSAFPKSRETKKPRVTDLVRHKNELDPKHLYLTKAPEKDAEGHSYVIRFSRKTKSHYLASETEEGKSTGSTLIWQGEKWVPQKD